MKYTRTVLITGGTTGLGFEAAKVVAKQAPDSLIVIASRSDRNDAAGEINRLHKQDNVRFRALDLGSLDAVRSFAAKWLADGEALPPIQSLVLNAGLQFPGPVEYSVDGYERTFAIGHIGHALLLALLRRHLANQARVVIVASDTHDPAKKTGMPLAHYETAEILAHPTVESSKTHGRQRYTSTKLSNVMFAYALHHRFETANLRHGKKWTVVSFDPGLMFGTGLARDAALPIRIMFGHVAPALTPVLQKVYNSNIHKPKESGAALARLAVGSDAEGLSGVYVSALKAIRSSEMSYDKAKQEDLWQWTVTLGKDDEERKLLGLSDLA